MVKNIQFYLLSPKYYLVLLRKMIKIDNFKHIKFAENAQQMHKKFDLNLAKSLKYLLYKELR